MLRDGNCGHLSRRGLIGAREVGREGADFSSRLKNKAGGGGEYTLTPSLPYHPLEKLGSYLVSEFFGFYPNFTVTYCRSCKKIFEMCKYLDILKYIV